METKDLILLVGSATVAIGAIIGVIITSFVNLLIKKKEVQYKIAEKIFDKRIKAHDDILELAGMMHTTSPTDEIKENGVVITYPSILKNKATLIEFQLFFFNKLNPNSHWLSNKLNRELRLIQDYISTLSKEFKNIDEKQLPNVGKLICDDFINFSSNLEELALQFYQKDIASLSLIQKEKYLNATIEERSKKLQETLFCKKYEEIRKIITGHDQL